MTQSLNQRFTYSNPPHPYYPAIADWTVYDDGERIAISQLVETANQQEAHIADLLTEIQRLTAQVENAPPAALPILLEASPN